MPVRVRIPARLRTVTQGQTMLTAEGSTVGDLIEGINQNYPGFREKLCDAEGLLRRYINLYVNSQWNKSRTPEEITLKPGDEVSIVFAIAGG